jgi:hypothetical protein
LLEAGSIALKAVSTSGAPSSVVSFLIARLDRRLEDWAVICYLVAQTLAECSRMTMTIPWSNWQLMDPELLQGRLRETLWNLHAQPPLMNLWAGLALKLERAGIVTSQQSLLALQLVMGACVAWGVGRLARVLVRSRPTRLVAVGLVVFHPVLCAMTFHYGYSLHEAFALTFIPLALAAYLKRPRARGLAALGALVVFLAMTRSLFHFAWGLAMIGLALAAAWRAWRRPPSWREWATVVACGVALMAWPVKNKVVFGFLGSSSWQGYNFSRALDWDFDEILPGLLGLYREENWGGVPVHWTARYADIGVTGRGLPLHVRYFVKHPDVSADRPVIVTILVDGREASRQERKKKGFYDERLRPELFAPGNHDVLLLVDRTWTSPEKRRLGIGLYPMAWETPRGLENAKTFDPVLVTAFVPKRYQGIPTLTQTHKNFSALAANRNHFLVIEDSRRRMALALDSLRSHPSALWRKACLQYWAFARSPLRDAWSGARAFDFTPFPLGLANWTRAWDLLLCQDAREEKGLRWPRADSPWHFTLSGFALTFPALLALTATGLIRRRRPIRRAVVACMLFSLAWVVTMIVLVDGMEGNRMRASSEPAIILLWACQADAALAWLRARRQRKTGARAHCH